jgi:hypothetical protein
LEERANEPEQYLDGRHLGPCESCWRLFEYPIHEYYPSVVRLQLHPEDQQIDAWTDDMTTQDLQEKAASTETTLAVFFKYIREYPEEKPCFYYNLPIRHVYRNGQWKLRQRRFSIGRMYRCLPTVGEVWYLRRLLTKIPSLKSFQDFRTVNRVVYPTL